MVGGPLASPGDWGLACLPWAAPRPGAAPCPGAAPHPGAAPLPVADLRGRREAAGRRAAAHSLRPDSAPAPQVPCCRHCPIPTWPWLPRTESHPHWVKMRLCCRAQPRVARGCRERCLAVSLAVADQEAPNPFESLSWQAVADRSAMDGPVPQGNPSCRQAPWRSAARAPWKPLRQSQPWWITCPSLRGPMHLFDMRLT